MKTLFLSIVLCMATQLSYGQEWHKAPILPNLPNLTITVPHLYNITIYTNCEKTNKSTFIQTIRLRGHKPDSIEAYRQVYTRLMTDIIIIKLPTGILVIPKASITGVEINPHLMEGTPFNKNKNKSTPKVPISSTLKYPRWSSATNVYKIPGGDGIRLDKLVD